MEFCIEKQWNSLPIDHPPICIQLSSSDDSVIMEVSGPFFGDPVPPVQPQGAYPKLYDYEVAEAFFLNNETKQYLEVELSPQGYHLVLLLDGYRNVFKEELPLTYEARVNSSTWTGRAVIPSRYFPLSVDAFNAYAIHGSGDERVYEALYPTPLHKYTSPDFHCLEYFSSLDFKKLL
ncbi:hypothetical protein CAPTEDRAFT_86229, partial [Capitella teleta]